MKVLIISHNPICTYDNMGKTILSLFSCFKKEEICQLYVYPSMPDADRCSSWYRITDREVLKSLRPFAGAPGEEISMPGEDCTDLKAGKSKKDMTQEQESLLYIIRDIVWRISGWYSGKLRSWLDREDPGVIFLTPGSSRFIYDVAIKISQERNIPLVMYICDDFYFLDGKTGIIRSFQMKMLRKKIRKTLERTCGIVTICEDMRRSYSREFGLPVYTVMTGAGIERHVVKEVGTVGNLSYFGNLTYNRYLGIAEIGRALDRISDRTGQDVQLRVYSRNDNKTINTEFEGIRSIRTMGFLSGEEYAKAFFDSDILIHTEAFDEECISRVRHSVSTKIADSLASGIMLFAYGPEGIASMDHLKENRCAWIVEQSGDLEEQIEEMLNNPGKRTEIAAEGLKIAEKCHDSMINSEKIRSILESAADGRLK